MGLSWDGFKDACKEVAALGGKLSAEDKASIWRALDGNCCGLISLKDWDEHAHAQVAEFKAWACWNYGSCAKLMRVFNETDTFSVYEDKVVDSDGEVRSAKRWINARCSGLDPCSVDFNFIFDGLDASSNSLLLEDDIKFLDSWDDKL